jgi:acyl-homoserine-lactone acylase
MDLFGENFRGLHAQQLLSGSRAWTLEKLNAAAFDSYQPGFASIIPPLLKAFDDLPKNDPRSASLSAPVAVLRTWNFRWGAGSIAQSLGIFFGDELLKALGAPAGEPRNISMLRLARDTSPGQKLDALTRALGRLRSDFGRWQVPWGEINRFQRVSGAIKQAFDDSQPSIPMPFADGNYGSLAGYRSGPMPGTKRWYQIHGNTFVAIVEFGNRVRARAIREGGESGDPASPHFNDEAQRYASGALRDVYFYPDQLKGHTEREYRPGE